MVHRRAETSTILIVSSAGVYVCALCEYMIRVTREHILVYTAVYLVVGLWSQVRTYDSVITCCHN